MVFDFSHVCVEYVVQHGAPASCRVSQQKWSPEGSAKSSTDPIKSLEPTDPMARTLTAPLARGPYWGLFVLGLGFCLLLVGCCSFTERPHDPAAYPNTARLIVQFTDPQRSPPRQLTAILADGTTARIELERELSGGFYRYLAPDGGADGIQSLIDALQRQSDIRSVEPDVRRKVR